MKKIYWNGDVGYLCMDGSGITVATVQQSLDAASGGPIFVELSTFGGDFFQAIQILNLLRNYQGEKTLYINGLVASAGTVIMLAFPVKNTFVRPTSMLMIHNAQSGDFGDFNDLRELADQLQKISTMVATEYAARTGKTVAEIQAMMDEETWLMGQEIVDSGFAGNMEDTTQQAATSLQLTAMKSQFKEKVTMWKRPSVSLEDQSMRSSMANCEKLIKAGDVDTTSPWSFTAADADKMLGDNGDDWANLKKWHVVQDTALPVQSKGRYKYPYGKNDKVYRSALRSIASRAAAQNLQDVSDWASSMLKMIDNMKGDMKVNEEEIIAYLKDKPAVFVRVAEGAGHGQLLATKEHTAAVEMSSKLKAENIVDPMATIVQLRKDLDAVEADRVTNAMDAAFGPVKLASGQENTLRTYAGVKLQGVKSTELAAKIDEFKKDTLALKLAGELMDANKEVNLIGFSEVNGSAPKSAKETVDLSATVIKL